MKFRFKSRKLKALFEAEAGARDYEPAVVDAFFDVMAIIAAAADERDFYALKSLHFEKLTGDRKGQHSIRLNKKWRLIVTLATDKAGKVVVVIEIVDYH